MDKWLSHLCEQRGQERNAAACEPACLRACVRACVRVPVLAVLSVVVVSTVTDVSMGGAGLPVTLSLIFTWIQMAGVRAAFSIVAWEREETTTGHPVVDKNTP